ncbi:MAG: hypothetical protein K5656_04825 [Lachnospiraceae bacterium]|nr:hypothetical protein [Lachnospiraceae bacterium]
MAVKGVSKAKKKDGSIYYRSSITYRSKHISLGSAETESKAAKLYKEANDILNSKKSIDDYIGAKTALAFDKIVTLINFRDTRIYIRNPIYLYRNYFLYYLDENTPLIFDTDDLFYYSEHKIQQKGGYLFVAEYGMQINILSRYGIKNYGVCGKDYFHANQNNLDYTYDNIEVVNPYYGVSQVIIKKKPVYKARLHINGNYLIGKYESAVLAAIAYNKAVDTVMANGCNKKFQTNYIEKMSAAEYKEIYSKIKIADKIADYKADN